MQIDFNSAEFKVFCDRILPALGSFLTASTKSKLYFQTSMLYVCFSGSNHQIYSILKVIEHVEMMLFRTLEYWYIKLNNNNSSIDNATNS